MTSRCAPSAFRAALWFLLEINCIKLFDCIGQQIIKLDRISWIIKVEFRLCLHTASFQCWSTETSLSNIKIHGLGEKNCEESNKCQTEVLL